MEFGDVRRARRKRTQRRRVLAAFLGGAAAGAAVVALVGFGGFGGFGGPDPSRPASRPPPARRVVQPKPEPRSPHVPGRPPQFVLVSFDGAGGDYLWPYWRAVARAARAHFTFFVSGVYLLDEARRTLYRPPRHAAGSSDIGFAQPERRRTARAVVRATLDQLAAGVREGHEIGTHYNGHFCAGYADSVGEWTAADWEQELDQFERLVFRTNQNNRLRPPVRLTLRPRDVVGGRTPCLEGNLAVLYRVLARRGFRYDASGVARLGEWPRRRLGIWSVPLLEIPLVGHTYRVLSMDYNFFVNQTGGASGPRSVAPAVERETYLSLRNAFRTSYFGNRAPLSIGNHFETWNHWAYNRALRRLVLEKCRLPEVRCVSIRELVDWLEAQPAARLARYRTGGFPRFTLAQLRRALVHRG